MRRPSLIVALVVATVIVAACGSEAAGVEPIPATALPGSSSRSVTLDASTVSGDAIDFAGLETLLEDAGFVGGTQRLFSRAGPGRRRTLARVLVFEGPGGADGYLAWLAEHVDEVIGDAAPAGDLNAPAGGRVFVHEPDACCHNETRIFLVMWRRDSRVITLEIGGPSARANDVTRLVSALDAAV